MKLHCVSSFLWRNKVIRSHRSVWEISTLVAGVCCKTIQKLRSGFGWLPTKTISMPSGILGLFTSVAMGVFQKISLRPEVVSQRGEPRSYPFAIHSCGCLQRR